MLALRGPPLSDCAPLPGDGVKSGFNDFVYNDRRRNALAQIRADRRFRRIGQYEARESKLVRAYPTKRIARKSLVGSIDEPALAHHTILQILRPIAVCEIVP